MAELLFWAVTFGCEISFAHPLLSPAVMAASSRNVSKIFPMEIPTPPKALSRVNSHSSCLCPDVVPVLIAPLLVLRLRGSSAVRIPAHRLMWDCAGRVPPMVPMCWAAYGDPLQVSVDKSELDADIAREIAGCRHDARFDFHLRLGGIEDLNKLYHPVNGVSADRSGSMSWFVHRRLLIPARSFDPRAF